MKPTLTLAQRVQAAAVLAAAWPLDVQASNVENLLAQVAIIEAEAQKYHVSSPRRGVT